MEFAPPRGSAAEDSVAATIKIGATVKIKPSPVIMRGGEKDGYNGLNPRLEYNDNNTLNNLPDK